MPFPSVAWETLGVTATAIMLFLAGAIGGWVRARISVTQKTWSQRTIVDMLIGGYGGVLLPTLAPVLNKVVFSEFQAWTPFQQSALAFFVGAVGSYLWTVIGWRKGWIAAREQVVNGGPPPPPEPGVLNRKEVDQ